MIVSQTQIDFSGGMNLLAADINLGSSEYQKGFNFRSRDDGLVAIKAPTKDTTAPAGKKQDIISFDNLIIIFNSGEAWYKDLTNSTAIWNKITGISLNPAVEFIYAEAVPVSKMNYVRQLQATSQINGSSLDTSINLTTAQINATPAGLICQDGISQPSIIFPNGTGRKIKTYEQWTASDREYVPVMTLMKYHQDILFGLAPDGVTLLRSVSGRPLDFVVNVDTKGNKGGKAETTAYSAGVNQVVCLNALKTGELFVGTNRTCHPLDLNWDKTIFGEPTFNNNKQFSAGVINQHSFLDVLTDYTMIDKDGIRSFNGIFGLGNEGRNSLFSRNIAKALIGIYQNTGAAILFDNYAIYAINTIFGQVLAVFDTITQLWICFDQLNIGVIKKFAVANISSNPVLFAITDSDVYTLYTGTNRLTATLYTRAFAATVKTGGRLDGVYITLDGNTIEDSPSITQIVDNKEINTSARATTVDDSVDSLYYNFNGKARKGKKIQTKISWTNDAKLLEVDQELTVETPLTPSKQTAKNFR